MEPYVRRSARIQGSGPARGEANAAAAAEQQFVEVQDGAAAGEAAEILPESPRRAMPAMGALPAASGVADGAGDAAYEESQFFDEDMNDEQLNAFVTFGSSALKPERLTEPTSYDDAMAGPRAKQWTEAINAENDALIERKVYRKVDEAPVRKAGIRPINSKIVWKYKYDQNGVLVREKVRIVAQGFTQEEGVNLFETFAAVANAVTVRVFVALVAGNKMLWAHIDVATAFLYSPMEETVYLRPPKPLYKPGKLWILLKHLYGLGGASRAWWVLFTQALLEFGLEAVTADNCFFAMRKNGRLLMVLIYVDDVACGADDTNDLKALKKFLKTKFKITEADGLEWFLSVHYARDNLNSTITATQ